MRPCTIRSEGAGIVQMVTWFDSFLVTSPSTEICDKALGIKIAVESLTFIFARIFLLFSSGPSAIILGYYFGLK